MTSEFSVNTVTQSALNATAEQLDIATEDAEMALDSVLESFEAAASSVEALESAMHGSSDVAREDLLASVMALRTLLRRSVVDLQFQDRFVQRMAMAAREIRALAGNGDTSLFVDGAVPKSAASLYNQQQLARINRAAGQPDPPPAPTTSVDDDIELF